MRLSLHLLLAAACSSRAAAAPSLPETVVVETRISAPAATSSPSVTRIDGADLAESGRLDLAAALAGTPGILGLTQAGEGSQTSIFTRGTNSSQTALLLDGRRLSPGFSGSYEPGRYRLDGLGSLEILRGASSALYGANALGGVIDLRLRNPLADAPGTSLAAEGGSFGRATLGLSTLQRAAGPAPTFGFALNVDGSREDGWRGNADRESAHVLGKAAWALGAPGTVAYLVFSADRTRAGLPGQRTVGGLDDPNDWQRDTGWLVSPGISVERGDFRGQVFWARSESTVTSYVDGTSFYGAYLYHQRFLLNRDEITALGETDLSPALTLGYGLTYERTAFDQKALDPFSLSWRDTQEGLGAWTRADWKLTAADHLRFGARADTFTDFGGKVTGELAWLRTLAPGLLLHAKLASAFRAPSANDLAYGTSGDRPLRPESNVATELGLRRTPEGPFGAGWTIVAFENRLTDLIDYDPADNYKTFNIGKARTRGLELGGEVRPAVGWRLFGAATWLEATALSDYLGIVSAGDRLLRRPDLALSVGVETRPTSAWVVGLAATWLRGREDFDFNTGARVDLRDSLQARLWLRHALTDRTDLSLRVENLAGSDAELTSVGYPAAPRAVYLGLTHRF